MKDDDTSLSSAKKDSSDASLFGKGRYKFWALAAILLLAFWSMLTGTVTLRWSAGNLNRFSDDLDTPLHDDLDVLEMEEREKVVKYMWDVYTNSRRIRLPKFWQQAFEAAYEDMISDVPGVREDAITEIAKMSIRSIDLDPPPIQLTFIPHSTFIASCFEKLQFGASVRPLRGSYLENSTTSDKCAVRPSLSFGHCEVFVKA